jgi:hypothetical protein
MHRVDPIYLEYQLKRWMRPDAHRFVRPHWRRFVRPEFQQDHPFALYERKYSPDQPRDDHGRWTDGTAQQPLGGISSDQMHVAGTVIHVCIAGSSSRFTIAGIKSYSVTYNCAGGRSFLRSGSGHNLPIIVIDPFR